jgi:hypothetical protein
MRAPHSHAIPDDLALDAGVQVAAAAVLSEERVQLGQQGHGGERSAARTRARGRGRRAKPQVGRRTASVYGGSTDGAPSVRV